MSTLTTCQICGRAIKTVPGWHIPTRSRQPLIAHHGYTRPGDGYQTASCFGARFRAYEVACDALPPAIRIMSGWKTRDETALAELLTSPPDTITHQPMRYGYAHGEAVQLPRPENFDVNSERLASSRSYEWEFQKRRRALELNIRRATTSLADMNKRLAEWKAPTTEKVAI